MQENEFKGILKKHADGFALEPKQDSFAAIVRKRNAVKRRRNRLFYLAAAVLLSVAGFGWMQVFNTDPAVSNTPQQEQVSASVNKPEPAAQKEKLSMTTEQNQTPEPESKSEKSLAKRGGKPSIPQSLRKKGGQKQIEKPVFITQENKNATDQRFINQPGLYKAKDQSNGHSSLAAKGQVLTANAPSASAIQKITQMENTSKEQVLNQSAIRDKKPEAGNGSSGTEKTSLPVLQVPENTQQISPVANTSGSTVVADTNAIVIINHSNQDSLTPDNSQNKPMKNAPGHKWAVQVFFTPQLFNSVYSANSDADLSWMKEYLNNKKENDQARYSYYTGLMIERLITERISVSAGVAYQMIKFEEIKVVNTVPPDETLKVNTMAMLDEQGLIKQVDRNRFDISFSSLEFPMQLSYTYPLKKWGIKMNAGVSYSYLFQTRSLVFSKEDSLNVAEINDASNNRLQQHNIFVSGGVTCLYRLSGRWEVGAGPVYRQAVYSLYSDDYVIRQRPYFVGLDAVVRYKF